jgi:hypothetical protein
MNDTLTPGHPRWPEFVDRLAWELDDDPCTHRTTLRSEGILAEMGLTLGAITRHAPSCDCEVLALDVPPAA